MWESIKQRLRVILWAASGRNALAAQLIELDERLTQRIGDLTSTLGRDQRASLARVEDDLARRVEDLIRTSNDHPKSLDPTLSSWLQSLENGLVHRLETIERKVDHIEEFSHGARSTYVGNNRVLVKAVVGGHNIAYLVEADDRLISPWFIVTGGYETELTNFFLRELRRDSHCIDVGSNFGYFTCLMGRLCPAGQILAIEADAHVFDLARDNIYINGFGHFATAIHAAATHNECEVELHRRVTRSGTTSITKAHEGFVRMIGEPETQKFTVQGVTIDGLAARLKGRVDFMKVDVEGAEPLVFAGARNVIAKNPQIVVVMEWSPGQISDAKFSIPEFLADLAQMGLQPFDILSDRIQPITWKELEAMPYRAGVVLKRAC